MDWRTKKILDHGFVHLLDAMPHWDHFSMQSRLLPADARIVQAARVSMGHLPAAVLEELGLERDDEERTGEQDEKLINYLMKNRHTTPFEKVRFEFVVKLPIFIARQWIRHRMGSFNEMSARYSKLPCEFYIPELERMQAQSTSNKQASAESLPKEVAESLCDKARGVSKTAYLIYEDMLDQGLARELARMVLPTNFYTQWYWTVDAHNLMHFLKLRAHSHAQWEIRVYAEAIMEMVERVAPVSMAAFKKHVMHNEEQNA